MSDFRKNGIVGIIEQDSVQLHFSEWWNGEGADFTFTRSKKDKIYSFHLDELHAIMVASKLMDMIDFDEIQKDVDHILKENKQREETLKQAIDSLMYE